MNNDYTLVEYMSYSNPPPPRPAFFIENLSPNYMHGPE